MGREMYGRETSRPQATPAPVLHPIFGTPMIDIRALTSAARRSGNTPGAESSPGMTRRNFLASRMPQLFELDPDFELNDQQAFSFMDEHGRYQSVIEIIKQGIQNVVVSELVLGAAASEELFVVLSALRDLEQFMTAAAMQKALMERIRHHSTGAGRAWRLPCVRPVAAMYPALHNPGMRNQLELILMWANDVGNSF